MEELLVNAVRGQEYQIQLIATYGADFNAPIIEVQLDTLHIHPKYVKGINLLDITSISPTLKSFFSEIVTHLTLILVMPAIPILYQSVHFLNFEELKHI